MIECHKCGEYHFEEDFYTNKEGKVNSACKSCIKAEYRTIPKLMRVMFNSQNTRAQHMNLELGYTRKEFNQWLLAQPNLVELYNNWRDSNWSKGLRPSVYRLNDYKTYSLSNIRLVTWEENDAKGHRDRRLGINHKVNHRVIVNGVLFPSKQAVCRDFGVSQNTINKIIAGISIKRGVGKDLLIEEV